MPDEILCPDCCARVAIHNRASLWVESESEFSAAVACKHNIIGALRRYLAEERAAQFRAAVAHLKTLRACIAKDTPKRDWLWLRFWLAIECYRAVGILPKSTVEVEDERTA